MCITLAKVCVCVCMCVCVHMSVYTYTHAGIYAHSRMCVKLNYICSPKYVYLHTFKLVHVCGLHANTFARTCTCFMHIGNH
jgi:hypothetical protein